ncbi:hypothetical protein HORIV_40160 [Vreelandella olivaria]|uniref:Tetratricopeptide repeat protein n=1 Tax=Vreelandella olivaria TaxID=390919 RepID=A0ABN5WXL1_9GAMM|nr:hypothetical protein HORIV_40160 [Halomonas olivaria]
MINTKIYKAVYELAEKLMKAADKEDREAFDALYAQLEAICTENENSDKDHPEQWETLADFTEELDEALAVYEKAFEKAVAINSTDHMSSIAFSMAKLQVELGQTDAAISNLKMPKSPPTRLKMASLKKKLMNCLRS